MMATRVELASIAFLVPKQGVEVTRRFRHVVTHPGDGSDQVWFRMVDWEFLSVLSTQTECDLTEGRQKRE